MLDREAPSSPPESKDLPRIGPVTKMIWGALVLAMAAIVVIKIVEPRPRPLPVLYHAASYALTDENGQPFDDSNLRGKAYVCDFIFTTCGSVCPMMSSKMRDLQSQIPSKVQFVSFSVDPARDTPAVLKEYAQRYKADLSRWHFLTGTSTQMFQTARQMRLTALPASESDPIMHDEHFLLVDGDGNVRGVYDSKDAAEMKTLVEDAKYLARSKKGRG